MKKLQNVKQSSASELHGNRKEMSTVEDKFVKRIDSTAPRLTIIGLNGGSSLLLRTSSHWVLAKKGCDYKEDICSWLNNQYQNPGNSS